MSKPTASRRKFVFGGAAILSAFALWKWTKPVLQPAKTVKMLSEDGELVEVDEAVLAAIRKAGRAKEAIACNSNTTFTSGDKVKMKLEGIKNFVRRK